MGPLPVVAYTRPSDAMAAPPEPQIPPLATPAANDGAAEKAAAMRGPAASMATIQPTPPSAYAPNGTYTIPPSGLRFRAPRCECTGAASKSAGPLPLTDPSTASVNVTGQPSTTAPLERSSAHTCQPARASTAAA